MASVSTAIQPAGGSSRPRVLLRRLKSGDAIAHSITLIFGATIILITVLLVYQLWVHSAPSRAKFGFHFFATSTWDPVFEAFGALPFIYGTLVTTVVALFIAIPLGLGAAIFLSELAPPKLSAGLSYVIDLLAAVPSVIYGMLAIFALLPLMASKIEPFLKRNLGFLPLFRGPAFGVGFLSAGLVLTVMIVPYIISVSREVLMAVPRDQREAALGLGATRWETTWRVVVPFARSGIMGSILLSMARALGETMAVTMVIGNTPKISASLLSPGYSIAAVIANEFSEATGAVYVSSLVELGLVLFLLTFILNGLARILITVTAQKGSEVSACRFGCCGAKD